MVKKTKQKEVILRVVRNTDSHPTAVWIYDEVRKRIHNISLGTIYRNLGQLAERGEILELKLAGESARFDGKADNHPHIKCQKCGWVLDVDAPISDQVLERVAQKTGFRILYYQIELTGLCGECNKEEKQNA